MRLLLPIFLLWLCAGITWAQTTGTTLTGRVLDAKTGEPLPFASVYINNTARGTTADSSGTYRLTNVPPGNQELVGSLLGYQTLRQPLRLTDARARQIDLRLDPGQTLAGVTVTARHSKVWQRQFREFSRELFGNRPQARQCQIMNPGVLSFQVEKGHLLAGAAEPLVITNDALGYRLYYDLLHFDLYKERMNFAGTARFEEMTAADTKQQVLWQRNRQRAYQGSLQHLLVTLLAGTHERAGYTVYQTPLTGDDTNGQTLPLVRTSERLPIGPDQARALFRPGELAFERRLVSTHPLEVYYNRVYTANSPYRDSPYAYSLLLLPNKGLELTLTGGITQGNGLDVRGYLGSDRLSTLLPLDWVSAADETLTPDNIAEGKPQRADAGLDTLVARRERAEKQTAPLVFVQTDKGFYCTGDQLWLSAYVLDAARNLPLAGRTGAVQVELIAPNGHAVQHQWLKLTDGRAATSFRFADTLSAGLYRLRAYTDQDQVASGPAFERVLSVCNLRQTPTAQPANPMVASIGIAPVGKSGRLVVDSLDVQMLPEGGRWLAGVPAVLGIKAITINGRGRAISGHIIDGNGLEVAGFTTNALGMGRVTLTPQTGQTYAALPDPMAGVITRPVALPAVETEGWALSADAVSDSTQLTVTARATGSFADQPVYVTLQSREQLVYRQKWSLQREEARFTLPIGTLPPGVCRLTLWDGAGHPRAERLVFVPQRDEGIRMQVSTGKPRYENRETVGIGLRFRDAEGYAVGGSWSAAVTDADQLPADTLQPTMRTSLLLTAGLRGPIESPDYYLQPNRLRDLDNLLLTQGWRRFPTTQPTDSTGGWSLSGRVVDKKGQPVANAAVVVQLQQGVQKAMRSLRTDAGGVFRLTGLQVADTLRVLANVTEPNGATLLFDAPGLPFPTPVLFSTPNAPTETPVWLSDARNRQLAWPAFYRDSTARQLAEVVVKANKPTDRQAERPKDVERASLHGHADAVLIPDENMLATANGISDLIKRMPGVRVDGQGNIRVRGFTGFGGNGPLFLVDGQPADGDVLSSIPLSEISRIELLANAGTAGIYGARSANGVIAIFTRKGGGVNPLPKRTSVTTTVAGFALPREFYVPRYDLTEPDPRPDRRDVLFWQPLGESGPDGLANLAFPLNDVAKRLRIVVQGISNEGVPISFTWVLPVR